MGRFSRKVVSLGKQDFSRVFQKNIRSADSHFVVLARRNQTSVSRLGLAIAKKHTARSTARNRIKRLIRESFYQQQPFPQAMDVVVMNRRQVELKTNEQIFSILDSHWQHILRKINRDT